MDTIASQVEVQAPPPLTKSWVQRASAAGRYVRIRDWQSRFLPTARDLFIYLPEVHLREPDRALPLLLMHDGQNLFDGDLSYVHDSTWRVGETADEEIAAGRVQPLIIVGVGNAGVERIAEYTPTPDTRLGGGKGPLYAHLLVEEVLPLVAARYPLLAEPENTGIAGSSLGGLISLAIALRYPQRFGKVGVISPSLWWDNEAVLKDVRSLQEHLLLRIWLDMGTAEGARHVHNTDVLAHLLEGKCWQPGTDLLYRTYPDAVHNEDAWAARLPEILRFLFPAS